MVNQIFKKLVPLEIIEDFIKKNSIFDRNKYIFNNYCFKKANFQNNIKQFLEEIEKYYHVSKKYYVKRNVSYIRFATVLRQLCKLHKLDITSKIKYYNSSYENVYFIDLTKSFDANK